MLIWAFISIVVYLWCSSCTSQPPEPHKSVCKWCTCLGGVCYNLIPLRLICWLSTLVVVSKVHWKGNRLGRCKDFHCTPVLVYLIPSSFLCSHCLFALNWHFWWGNGVKGPKMIPFWCLMPKGEKLRPKQMDQLSLVNFKNSRTRICILPKMLLLQNSVSCGGEFWLWEKGGVFGTWSISLLEYLSLCPNKRVLT
jgi:hypothetical protein